jgi:uncharacterized membrane protein
MLEKINNEPVLVYALVQAIIAAGVSFGLDLNGGQTAALLAVTGALLAIVCRGRVTPVVEDETGI